MNDSRMSSATALPYLPFGAGRRVCIAGELALHQMTLIALLTACRFRLLPTLLAVKIPAAAARQRWLYLR